MNAYYDLGITLFYEIDNKCMIRKSFTVYSMWHVGACQLGCKRHT